jgi:hypothetical protein
MENDSHCLLNVSFRHRSTIDGSRQARHCGWTSILFSFMLRRGEPMRILSYVCAVLVCASAGALQAGGVKSGPPVGSVLPGSFQPFNLNGKIGKNRYHCLVCEFGLKPTVMVFARDHPEGKDTAVVDLLQKLDQAVEAHQDSYLHAFVVFLSPDARTSVTSPQPEEPGNLVSQAAAWEALLARLTPRADKLKNVVVAAYPAEGPPGYQVAKDADVTVILYQGHKVLANYAFAPGQFNDGAVAEVMKAVDNMAREARKRSKAPTKKT